MIDYDVVILGGGINGCNIAYELSKYSLNIALIEMEQEIASNVVHIFYDKTEAIDFDAIKKFNVRSKKCYIKGFNREKKSNIINAYDLALGLGEVAFENGVNFRLNEEVLKVEKLANVYSITTNKNKIKCKIVIDTIEERVEEDNNIKNIIVTKKLKLKNGKCKFGKAENEDILAYEIKIEDGYIKVVSKNYSYINKVSSVAKEVSLDVKLELQCKEKKDFHDKAREIYRFRHMKQDEINELIKSDNNYGKLVCTCSRVTEGEIVECIRRPLGARTVDGIMKRTSAMLGICNGSYCLNKITRILAREINKNLIDIVKHSKDSNILVSRIKEFDEV